MFKNIDKGRAVHTRAEHGYVAGIVHDSIDGSVRGDAVCRTATGVVGQSSDDNRGASIYRRTGDQQIREKGVARWIGGYGAERVGSQRHRNRIETEPPQRITGSDS